MKEEHRREAVENVAVKYNAFPAGRVLVPTGTLIGPEHLAVLNEEYLAHEMQLTFTQRDNDALLLKVRSDFLERWR